MLYVNYISIKQEENFNKNQAKKGGSQVSIQS